MVFSHGPSSGGKRRSQGPCATGSRRLYAVICFDHTGRRHDRTVAGKCSLKPGSIVAFDRAYNDYALFSRWTESGIFFVTRQKENAVYEVIEKRIPARHRFILSDQIILLTGPKTKEKCPHPLRRVVVWDNDREIVLLTNHLDFGSSTIAAIYNDRWEIEIFFKTLKQHLKVKTFIGTSENALRIQIWTALIALLLLKHLHHLSKFGWSMSNLATMLRLNFFTYRLLLDWLHDPFGHPPDIWIWTASKGVANGRGNLVLKIGDLPLQPPVTSTNQQINFNSVLFGTAVFRREKTYHTTNQFCKL